MYNTEETSKLDVKYLFTESFIAIVYCIKLKIICFRREWNMVPRKINRKWFENIGGMCVKCVIKGICRNSIILSWIYERTALYRTSPGGSVLGPYCIVLYDVRHKTT